MCGSLVTYLLILNDVVSDDRIEHGLRYSLAALGGCMGVGGRTEQTQCVEEDGRGRHKRTTGLWKFLKCAYWLWLVG